MLQRVVDEEEKKLITNILDKISIFGGFTQEQYQRTFSFLEKMSFDENELIFDQGDSPNYIYIVISGEVKIFDKINNEAIELILFTEGQCFGETSIIGIQPHTSSALAVKKTSCVVLSRQSLMQIFKSDKDLFSILILNIAREACRRLYNSDKVLLNYIGEKHC